MSALFLGLGLLAVFSGILLALAIVGTITPERHTVERSLSAIDAISTAPASMRREMERPFGERLRGGFDQWLLRVGRRLTPQGKMAALRRRLDLAGNPQGWDLDRVIAFKALAMFVGGAVGVIVPLLLGSITWAIILGLGFAVLGYFSPNYVLARVADNRNRDIRNKLPDSLDLLTVSVEAGLGFDAALANVARNTTGPLAEEFFRVLQEMQLGSGRMQALRALSERTDVRDLQTFINAMVQADAFGIPIANVLRVQSNEMRVKRSQRAEEAAQKLPVKILFPLVFLIMPSIFVALIGPAIISLSSGALFGS